MLLHAKPVHFIERVNHCSVNPSECYDLLGMFNILDHTDGPMRAIQDGLVLARHVIIVTHHAAVAEKQHLFEFHELYSPETLERVAVEAGAGEVSEDRARLLEFQIRP